MLQIWVDKLLIVDSDKMLDIVPAGKDIFEWAYVQGLVIIDWYTPYDRHVARNISLHMIVHIETC